MKKILFIIMVLIGVMAEAQTIPGYANMGWRYRVRDWVVDSNLHIPRYNGVPTTYRVGGYTADGAIAADTASGYFYLYSGGTWIKQAKFSDITGGATPAGNYGNVQLNRNGALAVGASDSLSFNSGNLAVKGTGSITSSLTVVDNAYNATTWNGSFKVPTENAVRDKIESLVATPGIRVWRFVDYGVDTTGLTADNSTEMMLAVNACIAGGGGDIYIHNGRINGRVTIPTGVYSSSRSNVSIRFIGETAPVQNANPLETGGTNRLPDTSGVVWKAPFGTTGPIIKFAGTLASWNTMNFTHTTFENIGFRVRSKNAAGVNIAPVDTAMDARAAAYLILKNCHVDTESPGDSLIEPAVTSVGIITPYTNNWAIVDITNVQAVGQYIGFDVYEHATFHNSWVDACYYGVVIENSNHETFFDRFGAYRTKYSFWHKGNTAGQAFNVVSYNREGYASSRWFTFVADLKEDNPGQAAGKVMSYDAIGANYNFIRTNPVASRIQASQINGGLNKTSTANRPANMDTGYLYHDVTLGTNVFWDGTGYREHPWNGQTRNFYTTSAGKIGVNGDPTSLAYLFQVTDITTLGDLALFQSKSTLSNVRLSATDANDQISLRFAKATTDKWSLMNDIAGNGTSNFGIYNHATSASNISIDPDGTVKIGGNTTVAANLTLEPGGNSAFANETRHNTADLGAYNFQVGGPSAMFGNLAMIGTGTDNRTIDFGAFYGQAALKLYNGGAGVTYGWGLNGGEAQMFNPTNSHWSWNGGGDLQPSGTNELWRMDVNTGTFSNTGAAGTGYVHLKAGTTTYAPIRLTSGSLPTGGNILAGNIAFLTDKFYATISTGPATKELTLNDAALTSGVIPIATTNGRLTDGPGFTAATTYTPTLTNTTNVAASTASVTHYLRVGDWVYVWGEVTIDATLALTLSELGLSLPTTTDITQTYDLAGTASFEDNTTVQIKGDVTNNRAMFRFTPQSATNNKYNFHFSYKHITP